ncbi:MAG TPA: hypothetical protein VFZ00_29065, partial [Solirubrobacter sp.]|nr:hypothetical protein [Solirubrobacter sp.]
PLTGFDRGRRHRLSAVTGSLVEPAPQHADAAASTGLVLHTPVWGSRSSTRRAVDQGIKFLRYADTP